MADSVQVSSERLTSLVERIENLEEQRSAINADIREVLAEAKSAGFDTRIVRQIVRLRKMEPYDREEQEHLLEVYRNAVGV
ncbi:MAG: DUF2312 domain-containing protein [Alphaproteobacteria bacterium]|nr:DUF2312 domain-containing protein [Alphaproteobacteria bacterium]